MRWKVSGFDQLRLICSLLVVVGHARILSIGEYNPKSSNSPIVLTFFWFTSLGHSAVLIFFVLSGFLIGTPLVNSIRVKEIDLAEFLIKRLSRIWIVLIPSLIIISFINKTACSLNPKSNYCAGLLEHNMSEFPPLHMQSGNLALKNALFQFGNSGYLAFGGDLPIWSLNYEVFSYVLVATIVYLSQLIYVRRHSDNIHFTIRKRNTWIFLGCMFWILYVNPTIEAFCYFFIFLSGILAGVLRNSQKRLLTWKQFIFLSLALILILGQLIRHISIYRLSIRLALIDFVFASIFTILLIKSPEVPRVKNYYSERSIFDFSFSLYIIHLPVMGLIISVNEGEKALFKFAEPQEFFVMIFISLIFAFVLSIFTEGKTLQFRNFLLRKFVG